MVATTLAAVLVGVAVYLVLAERASDRRLEAAAAGLDLAAEEAALAGEFAAAARQAPEASAVPRLQRLTERAAVLEDRARGLPRELDDAVAIRLERAARDHLAGARAFVAAVEPGGGAARTVERAGTRSASRRTLRSVRRELAQMRGEIVPAARRFGAALTGLRSALEGIGAELLREDELDGAARARLDEANGTLRRLEGETPSAFGAEERVSRIEDRAEAAIERIDRRVAARRRARAARARRQDSQAPSRPPLVQLPNGQPGYALPEEQRSLGCVGTDAETGECVGD